GREGGRAARPPDPLLPRMCNPGAARRSENRPTELPLLRRHGRAPADGQTRRPHRELGAAGLAAADHGYAEEGRGRRILRGDSLFQRGPEAAPAGDGRDDSLHGGGRPGVRRRPQTKGSLDSGATGEESRGVALQPATSQRPAYLHEIYGPLRSDWD